MRKFIDDLSSRFYDIYARLVVLCGMFSLALVFHQAIPGNYHVNSGVADISLIFSYRVTIQSSKAEKMHIHDVHFCEDIKLNAESYAIFWKHIQHRAGVI